MIPPLIPALPAERFQEMTAANILVVEDDRELRQALSMTLELAGYEVTAVGDGHAALVKLGDSDFDLIVSDIQMRPMDGHTLLKEIKSRSSNQPVLLMTAYGTIPSAVEAIRNGAADYLVKPFDAEVLAAKVAELVTTPAKNSDGRSRSCHAGDRKTRPASRTKRCNRLADR